MGWPNGPTIETKTFMRASLVHDALYQLMREEHLELHALAWIPTMQDSADRFTPGRRPRRASSVRLCLPT